MRFHQQKARPHRRKRHRAREYNRLVRLMEKRPKYVEVYNKHRERIAGLA